MFSEEFMSFLVKYASEENESNKVDNVKEIEFKNDFKTRLAHVYVTISNR